MTSIPTAPTADLTTDEAAALPADQVLEQVGSTAGGLSTAEAARRLARVGPNAVRTHHTSAWTILARQFRNAVLILLLITAVISFVLGDHIDAVTIGVILLLSVGLGFGNEYRAAKTAYSLHSTVRYTAVVLRDGAPAEVDVTQLVPGDVVRLSLGEVVPADLRLLATTDLQCGESVLTGESEPADKSPEPVPVGSALADQSGCAFMGTVVETGAATGVVVATGPRAEFGRIAVGLATSEPETEFQAGLRRFSTLLVKVALALTVLILVINLFLHRPVLESVMFSLSIAIGLTPQLLPAVVSTSLAVGSTELAKRKVLVKRLVAIEDLGDIDVLVTDKTGTLTEGHISLSAPLAPSGVSDDLVLRLGLLATERDLKDSQAGAAGGNPLDVALWEAVTTGQQYAEMRRTVSGYTRLGLLPFDHDRQMTSSVVRGPDGDTELVVKGAPEAVLARCTPVPAAAKATLQGQFAAGYRVVAVARRPAPDLTTPTSADERDLILSGFLVFLDPPKQSAAGSLRRLTELGVAVKIATGDNPVVAEKVCADLGLTSGGTLTGAQLAAMDDATLAAAAGTKTIFARISPEQKARLVRLLRWERRRVSRRRRQRRPGPARRRRRHQRRQRYRRRQGRRRRDPAGEGSRGALQRRLRRPPDLRQHHEVCADGHEQQLRQHVQHGSGLRGAAVPTDAAEPDPAQQRALRHQPADDPHRQRRPGAGARALALGHRPRPPLHDVLRPDQQPVRLPHLRPAAGRVPCRGGAVPRRLVRGVSGHPDPGHLRDPDSPHTLLPQPRQPASGARRPRRRRARARPTPIPAGPTARLRPPAARPATGRLRDDLGLPRARRPVQTALLPRGGPPAAAVAPAWTRTPHRPPSLPFHRDHTHAPRPHHSQHDTAVTGRLGSRPSGRRRPTHRHP
jgi:high-affinity K+ transport system ATPase subunit B